MVRYWGASNQDPNTRHRAPIAPLAPERHPAWLPPASRRGGPEVARRRRDHPRPGVPVRAEGPARAGVPLSAFSAAQIMKAYAERAGLDAQGFAGHSLRSASSPVRLRRAPQCSRWSRCRGANRWTCSAAMSGAPICSASTRRGVPVRRIAVGLPGGTIASRRASADSGE